MNIAGVEYNFNTKAIEIYVAGCNQACPGCHNKELWDFNKGTEWYREINRKHVALSSSLFDRIWIMGGEPLDQNSTEMLDMIYTLKLYDKELWLWTSYALGDVCNILNKDHFSYVKTGAYKVDLPAYSVKAGDVELTLASSNQTLHKIN